MRFGAGKDSFMTCKKRTAIVAIMFIGLAAASALSFLPSECSASDGGATDGQMQERLAEMYEATADVMTGFGEPGFGNEWIVFALARGAGNVPDGYFEGYLERVADKLKETDGDLLGSSGKKYTEYERTIIALTSLGVDVSDMAGYNLLARLTDYDRVTWQGLNAADFALIALDSHDYEIPQVETGGNQLTRGKLIDNIIASGVFSQGAEGDAASEEGGDPDMSAISLQALTPYYRDESKFDAAGSQYTYAELQAAVEEGIEKLSSIQNPDGGYTSWDFRNSESCAQVIIALTGLGIDPAGDPRFKKNGGDPLSSLMSFYVPGGGFMHTASDGLNHIATEQAYYALAAYGRFKSGAKALYDMRDIGLEPYDVESNFSVDTGDASRNTFFSSPGGKRPGITTAAIVTAVIVFSVLAVFITISRLRKKRKNGGI